MKVKITKRYCIAIGTAVVGDTLQDTKLETRFSPILFKNRDKAEGVAEFVRHDMSREESATVQVLEYIIAVRT